jgi:hypothetical protein
MGSDFAPLHLGDGTFGLIARAKFYGTAFKEISRDIDLSASRGCSRAQVHRRTQDNGFDCHASIRVNGRDPIIAKAALARLSLRSQQIKINSGLVGRGDPQILARPFFAIPPGAPGFYLTRLAPIPNKTAQRQLCYGRIHQRTTPCPLMLAQPAASAAAAAACSSTPSSENKPVKCGPDQEVGAVLGRTQTAAGK